MNTKFHPRFVIGCLLLLLLILVLLLLNPAPARAQPRELHGPPGSVSFGTSVTVVPGGWLVITDPDFTAPGNVERAGAAHLYDSSLHLLSSLTGSSAGDRVGLGGVTVLPDGKYAVISFQWNNGQGAVTWCDYAGRAQGVVSEDNSLTGGQPGDQVGRAGITAVGKVSYVVASPDWHGGRGAVTWCQGGAPPRGRISAANSLTGTAGYPDRPDLAGNSGVGVLDNGNYLVFSPEWGGQRGAVTWGDGRQGVSGEISDTNSLTGPAGTQAAIGASGMVGLHLVADGNFVLSSPARGAFPGAATWGGGTTGVTGEISAANSLVNTSWGGIAIRVLPNGNYVARSMEWNEYRGAVTWGSGAEGVRGEMSAANSLTGTRPFDLVGRGGVTVLANGDYVVASPAWNEARGAVTWAGGAKGLAGEVSAVNSLVGATPDDGIGGGGGGVTALANGDYVVASPAWGGNRGAVTWGDGGAGGGVTGDVSSGNSLVGTRAGTLDGAGPQADAVGGFGGVTALSNGNYVVTSNRWNGHGAVTWGSGAGGVSGEITAANSLINAQSYNSWGGPGVTALGNGNYLVATPGRGAVTWCDGAKGLTGEISVETSLLGVSFPNGTGAAMVVLKNDNYLVCSPEWNEYRGAVTWGSGMTGVRGEVSSVNSLVGANPYEWVGASPALTITALRNGNYLVRSPLWNGGRGAVTWGGGAAGVTGGISAANSLAGTREGDKAGSGEVVEVGNGNYVVLSHEWHERRGAVTWGSGNGPLTGEISAANSLVGTDPDDRIGYANSGLVSDRVTVLPNGNYVVRSRFWGQGRGAVTWGGGAAGVSGEISVANSLTGTASQPLETGLEVLDNGDYLVTSQTALVYSPDPVLEAVTIGDGALGAIGLRTPAKSFIGTVPVKYPELVTVLNRRENQLIVGCPSENRVALFSLTVGISVTGADDFIAADFGSVPALDGTSTRVFEMVETGAHRLVLTGDPQVVITRDDDLDFTVTRQPSFDRRDALTFEIAFAPLTPGPQTALVSIASNSARNPFIFRIRGTGTGTGAARGIFDGWRDRWFGDAGDGTAPGDDFDGDGISNLLEFAFGTDPTDKSGGPAPLDYTGPLTGGGGGALAGRGGPAIILTPDGGPSAVWLRRQDRALAGVRYTPQVSGDLIHWREITDGPAVLAMDGAMEAVTVPLPATTAGGGGEEGKSRFLRLTVTLEP